MDKNTIKKYAVWARRELIERVSQRAMIYGTTAKDAGDPNAESVNGHLLSQAEKRQRQALIRNIKEKGYEQVMEEVAYTWFNRFAALRFMEVNGYLPSHVRVFTNDAGEFKPQILAEAIHLELDGLDMNKVYELENANKTEELYKYLLIVQCNALNGILPGLFQRIEDYTELLLPDYLLREGSVVEQMVTMIPEKDWTDQVQIIGWLYQYYNTELKDKVFADLKKNIKITKENIPAATQLFTPDWIVHYMVENSLGRLWLEGHPNDVLKSEWMYYLDEAEQEPEVQAQLAAIRKEYAALKPEEIRVIDPCMGSGHILCVLFDVLVRIYEDYGYTAREAAVKIVENNLYGLDIDERAAQLAYFSVMMKARQCDRLFFTRQVQPHVYATASFKEGKEYGSLLLTEDPGERCGENEQLSLYDNEWYVRKLLVQKYDVVVANPPYMATSNVVSYIGDRIKKDYPDSKADFFAAFIERCAQMTKTNRYQAMITQHAWMFLSSYEKLRSKLENIDLVNLLHLGPRAFEEIGGEVVQTSSFVLRQSSIKDYQGIYCRLIEPTTQQGKEDMFLAGENRYTAKQSNFSKIPGSPVAYWVSKGFILNFNNKSLYDYSASPSQNITGNNDRFVRKHWELSCKKIGVIDEWIFYAKGGGFRKWWGNLYDVVNWTPEARYIYQYGDGKHASQIINKEYWYLEGITWGLITSSLPSFRIMPYGATYDKGGSTIIVDKGVYNFTLGLLNSKIYIELAKVLNPTLNFQVKDVRSIPIIIKRKGDVDSFVEQCVDISKFDWDSFETSWDFQCHPLVRWSRQLYDATSIGATMAHYYGGHPKVSCPLELCFLLWQGECEERFQTLKANEEELNRIFIDIYGLQDELTPEVEDKDVTVRRADLGRDIRSLISYAVGCMFGRYSLDKPGLVYAGGEWNQIYRKDRLVDESGRPITFGGLTLAVGDEYTYVWDSDHWVELSFSPDKDNIIPICDDDYFEDDITGKFIKWVEAVYGKDTLEENLKFIADALGGKGSSREVIRNYFLNDFYADHLKTYQKRPIYWLFDSGKKNGFKCLIYIHRYQPDTIARIRTDYVHEQQSRYRTAIASLEQRINGASTSERVKLNKQLQKLQAQAEEIRVYEEKIHHLADQMIKIDLDDGVKHNYALFQDVMAKIK